MWTRGSEKSGFKVEVFGLDGALIEVQKGFPTAQEADRWGEQAQRAALFPGARSQAELDAEMEEIDALLAELEA